MSGKGYVDGKVACEAVISCRLLDRRAAQPDAAGVNKS
jgi:hypothetical protein